MIRIARAEFPTQLLIRLEALTDEIARAPVPNQPAEARAIWRRANVRTAVRTPVSEVLRRMAPGREHCMYCGDNQGTDVDHYEPIAHNPLRTFDWLNHVLACSFCNSQAKRDRFPVDDDGKPLLIDPCTEDPFEHLLLTLSLGVYAALTEKGSSAIEVCGLNRALLVRGRVQARRVVELCLAEWGAAHTAADHARKAAAVLTVQEQPFADVCQSMLRQAESPGAETVFADPPAVLPLLRLPELRASLLS
jgi:hypothetical protein